MEAPCACLGARISRNQGPPGKEPEERAANDRGKRHNRVHRSHQVNSGSDRQNRYKYTGRVTGRPPANRYQTTIMSCFGKRAWDPKGKVSCPQHNPRCSEGQTDFLQHCYVTGGSTGLGLALSILLANRAQTCQSSHVMKTISRPRLRS
jgi:hypothetical protein